jgi:hypothetical protein
VNRKNIGVAVLALLLSNASALALEPIGVAACDAFIAKYEACIATKIAAERQAQLTTNVTQLHAIWAKAAADPNQQATLASMCAQTAQGAKQTPLMKMCAW